MGYGDVTADASAYEVTAADGQSNDLDHTNAALCSARHNLPTLVPPGEAMAGSTLTEDVNDVLTARQSRAALLLAAGQSVSEVARAIDVHRGTIHRWLRARNGAFQRELQRQADELSTDLESAARRLMVKATHLLDRMMNEDVNRLEWAARIIRNRHLWRLARPESIDER